MALGKALEMTDETVEKIAEGVARGIAGTQRKKIGIGQYDPRSPFHPDKFKTPKLKRKCYQNGVLMLPDVLYDKEIDLLNRIKRSGHYCEGLVTVTVAKDGGGHEAVLLAYTNKTTDQRFDLKGHFRNLKELLQIIVDDQEQDATA